MEGETVSVTVELSAEEVAILDELRKEEPGMTLTDAIKLIVQLFGKPDKPMTLGEVVRLMTQSNAAIEAKKPLFRFPNFPFTLE